MPLNENDKNSYENNPEKTSHEAMLNSVTGEDVSGITFCAQEEEDHDNETALLALTFLKTCVKLICFGLDSLHAAYSNVQLLMFKIYILAYNYVRLAVQKLRYIPFHQSGLKYWLDSQTVTYYSRSDFGDYYICNDPEDPVRVQNLSAHHL